MTATINSTRGQTLGYDQETALGTSGGSYGEIRQEAADLAWPTNTRIGIKQPNVGHAHPANRDDQPVWHETVRESAGSLTVKARRSASTNTAAPITEWFESMGCHAKTTAYTTVGTFTSTSQFTLTLTDGTAGVEGDIILPLLDYAGHALDNYYYPTLVMNEATGVVKPAMALPTETDETEPVDIMTTIYPIQQSVAATKTLAFYHHTRGDYTGDGSNDLAYLYTGCAAASVDEFTVAPATPLEFKFNFHLGDVDLAVEEIAAETFVDSEKFIVINEKARFEFSEVSTSPPTAALTRSDAIIKEAKINLGVKSVPRKGFGDGCLNDISGYDLIIEDPKMTVTWVMGQNTAPANSIIEQPESLTNKLYYCAVVQPTNNLDVPAFACFFPECHLDGENPPVIKKDGDLVEITATFLASTAKFATAGGGLDTDSGYAPWYLGISGEYSA